MKIPDASTGTVKAKRTLLIANAKEPPAKKPETKQISIHNE